MSTLIHNQIESKNFRQRDHTAYNKSPQPEIEVQDKPMTSKISINRAFNSSGFENRGITGGSAVYNSDYHANEFSE